MIVLVDGSHSHGRLCNGLFTLTNSDSDSDSDSKPDGTLYYAEVFTLVPIQIQIHTQMISGMVTVPILGTDVHPKDRYLSQFYFISIRGSKSESESMRNICILQ